MPITIFRPSIVLGDSRRAETTQFDMVRAFVFLAGLPVLPFRPNDQIDIVNVDFVADAIATLHQKEQPAVRYLPPVFGEGIADVSRVDHARWPRRSRSAGRFSCRCWSGRFPAP